MTLLDIIGYGCDRVAVLLCALTFTGRGIAASGVTACDSA